MFTADDSPQGGVGAAKGADDVARRAGRGDVCCVGVGGGLRAAYGARALQRMVESVVVATLARHLVAHPELRNMDLILDLEDAVVVA